MYKRVKMWMHLLQRRAGNSGLAALVGSPHLSSTTLVLAVEAWADKRSRISENGVVVVRPRRTMKSG